MQTLQLDSLASHIVAWHNRHPLARRIGVQHLQSLGYVVLPFVATAAATAGATVDPGAAAVLPTELTAQAEPQAADGASLRERAMARASQGPAETPASPEPQTPQTPNTPQTPRPTAPVTALRPAFTEDFIRPLRPAVVAAFALQHGAAEAAPGKDNPVRLVKPDAGVALPQLHKRWLLTAQIDVDGRRTRLLAGAGHAPALLGKRLWSLPRVGLAVGLPLLVVAVLVMGFKAVLEPAATEASLPADKAAGVASPASSASSAIQATDLTAAAAAATTAAASAPAVLQSAPERPTDVDPSWGRVNLPSIGVVADEKRKAALAARQAAPAAATALAVPTAAAPATAQAGQKAAPAVITEPAFALSSRIIRTRAESEQIADAMRGLLVTGSDTRLQVEALRSGDDWRVVCWPFLTREQADKARALLASRGMKLQVVDF